MWNGFGVIAWGGTSFTPDTFLSGYSDEYRDYVASLPLWSMISWGLGVLGGFAGSILILLRRRLAQTAIALSLIGAVTNTMVYFTNPAPDGFFNLPLTVFINGFAFFLLWFAHLMNRRGILH